MKIQLKLDKRDIGSLARELNKIYREIPGQLEGDPVSIRFYRYELEQLQKSLVRKLLNQGPRCRLNLNPPAAFVVFQTFNNFPDEFFEDISLVREIVGCIDRVRRV
jgi:hypothetical protein